MLIRNVLRLKRQDRSRHDLYKPKRTIFLLYNLAWIIRLLNFTSLLDQLDLLLPQHLGAPLVELISLLKVMLGFFWSKLIQDILNSGFFRYNLDRKGLLHLEHVFHKTLVSIFTVERVAPCASQVIDGDIRAHVGKSAP